jgi:O-methyltransferase
MDLFASILAVSEAEVRANFQRYGLLDDQVRFLPGWFNDTLHDAPIDRIAVLRLDGDLYESTIQALDELYARLSPGVSASLMIH